MVHAAMVPPKRTGDLQESLLSEASGASPSQSISLLLAREAFRSYSVF